jgi:tetratricopeptide (TPR) repeat protein
MLRNKLFTPLFLASLVLTGAAAAFGQTAAVGGRVELKKADGTTEPVANATVDCYRSDAGLKCRSTQTNSRGEFTFLGIPFSGRVILAVSGPGISPVVYPGVKAGQVDIIVQVLEGEGPALSEEEVRRQEALFLANPTGELTDDQKKAQEEYEKKLAEVKAKNEKIEKKNQIIERTLKEGNEAYNSGNYDLAIAKYEEGIEADPDFVGSAPVLLNNKGAALKKRAVDVYNTAAKGKDPTQIAAAKVKAAADLVLSLDAYGKSFGILKNAKPEEITDQNNYKGAKANAADGGRDAVRIMVLLKTVDGSKNAEAKELTEAYIANETDKKKQAEAQSNMAAYLFEGGDFNGSVVEYRQAYELSPKDPDVLAKYSLALYTVAEANQDAAMKQESLNVMEVYLSAAPKDHSLRADIAGLADYLKNTEKLKPQKMN